MQKKTVLFVCTHNSARSQMSEGLLRHIYGERYEVLSCGTKASVVNPLAIQVMSEIGIDISSQYSKDCTEYAQKTIDLVVTVCDNAKETCPFFRGGKAYLHKSFADPKTVEDFRAIRDEISNWIKEYFNKQILTKNS